jgi:hypothetical protein
MLSLKDLTVYDISSFIGGSLAKLFMIFLLAWLFHLIYNNSLPELGLPEISLWVSWNIMLLLQVLKLAVSDYN